MKALDFKNIVALKGSDRVLLRDVWKELGSTRQYRNWAEYYLPGFTEGSDFGLFNKNVKNSETQGRPTIDHWVTVDTAKQLAMMQRTDKGREIRQYFLECERLVYENGLEHQLTHVPDLANPDVLVQLALNYKKVCEERDEALAVVAQTEDYAADHAEEHGLTSIAIIKKYPEQSKKLIEETKPKIRNLTKYGPSGVLTVGLRHNGITSKIAKLTPKGPAALFNTKEVDDFMKGYEQC
jgi:phage anti-repressor protein